MIELSFDQAKSIVTNLIQEFGEDHVYIDPNGKTGGEIGSNCCYVHGDEPGCIVGQILHRAGVPLESLSLWDYPNGGQGVGARSLIDLLGVNADQTTISYLVILQNDQDSGRSWGAANRVALEKC